MLPEERLSWTPFSSFEWHSTVWKLISASVVKHARENNWEGIASPPSFGSKFSLFSSIRTVVIDSKLTFYRTCRKYRQYSHVFQELCCQNKTQRLSSLAFVQLKLSLPSSWSYLYLVYGDNFVYHLCMVLANQSYWSQGLGYYTASLQGNNI